MNQKFRSCMTRIGHSVRPRLPSPQPPSPPPVRKSNFKMTPRASKKVTSDQYGSRGIANWIRAERAHPPSTILSWRRDCLPCSLDGRVERETPRLVFRRRCISRDTRWWWWFWDRGRRGWFFFCDGDRGWWNLSPGFRVRVRASRRR